MTSKMLFAGYSLIVLLLVTESKCPASDERSLQIISMAKAASGGTAWDSLQIMHDAGKVTLENGEVLRYEHWGDLRTLNTRAGSGTGDMILDGRAAYKCQTVTCDSPTKLAFAEIRSAAYLTCFGFFSGPVPGLLSVQRNAPGRRSPLRHCRSFSNRPPSGRCLDQPPVSPDLPNCLYRRAVSYRYG
jgi:hypothetical protein